MYSNNIVNFQESTTILNACTKKKSGNLLKAPGITKQSLSNVFYNIIPLLKINPFSCPLGYNYVDANFQSSWEDVVQ